MTQPDKSDSRVEVSELFREGWLAGFVKGLTKDGRTPQDAQRRGEESFDRLYKVTKAE